MGKGTRIIIIVLCAVVVLAIGVAGTAVLYQRHQHAEQDKRHAAAMASQAKVADDLASDLDSAATDYTGAVSEVEPALASNTAAVKAWKKRWSKRMHKYQRRMAKYRRKLAAVKAYNNSPAGHVRWIPNVRTSYFETSRPGYLLYLEPSIPHGDVWWSDGGQYAGEINGVLTKRPSRPVGGPKKLPHHPKRPKRPAKIPDPLVSQRVALEGVKAQLDTLTTNLDSAKLGPEFVPVADEIRSGIELLRTNVDQTLNAFNTTVHSSRRMGHVAVHKTLTGVDVTGADVDEAVQAVRDSLINAAKSHNVDPSNLTWGLAQP
jgi:hypothetical protein